MDGQVLEELVEMVVKILIIVMELLVEEVFIQMEDVGIVGLAHKVLVKRI